MKARDARRASAGGGRGIFLSHASPEAGLAEIIPALLSVKSVKLAPQPRAKSSATVMQDLLARGAKLESVPFSYYRAATYQGANRLLDNTDIMKGKEVLYTGFDHAVKVSEKVRIMVHDMIAFYEPLQEKNLIASMEMQDLPKVTIQQWKPTGWHLASPVTDAKVPRKLSPEALRTLKKVASHYGEILSRTGLKDKTFRDLALMDSDPQTTMTGAPTYVSGARSHEARLATLAALPPPTLPPSEWILRMESLAHQLGFRPEVFYSPVLSTRTGPLRKETDLWVLTPAGYESRYVATGIYNRTRFVYPAPYFINFILSPLYVQMAAVRQNKLGLWHDPKSQEEYIRRFKAQGGNPYTIDFSGMDTAMWPNIIEAIMLALKDSGFFKWSLDVMIPLYKKMGVVLPSYSGQSGSATLLTGPVRPWCSGFKLTSEFDTIYGAAVLLSALERQRPGITDEWINGNWLFAELGDDIIFTASFNIDPNKLAQDALDLWGAKLEIIQDAMFLKWFLPIHPDVPKKCRSLARFVQQTFYNEDRYTGAEGGDKPPAVMRLALMARMIGMNDHPHFSKWWPRISEILVTLKYVQEASPSYIESVTKGIPKLDTGDEQAILDYSIRVSSFLSDIVERAKYEPSAAVLLEILTSRGLAPDQTPGEIAIRTAYWEAYAKEPTPRDIMVLSSIAKP